MNNSARPNVEIARQLKQTLSKTGGNGATRFGRKICMENHPKSDPKAPEDTLKHPRAPQEGHSTRWNEARKVIPPGGMNLSRSKASKRAPQGTPKATRKRPKTHSSTPEYLMKVIPPGGMK